MPTEGPLTECRPRNLAPRHIRSCHADLPRIQPPHHRITESGCGYLDTPYDKEDGRVPDTRRIEFFRAELAELARAIADGARVRCIPRLEPARQLRMVRRLHQRYGLIYVDYRDQKRTIKDSGYWYAKVAASNRLDV